jgi:hypothetical protein
MRSGQDDESPLKQLLNKLDLHSALTRLMRVGFKLVGQTRQHHHLTRLRGEGQEDILIELNEERNHFIIRHAHNGEFAAYNQIIASWDDWVTFVRLLVLRAPNGKRARSESPDSPGQSKCPKQ